MCACKKGYFGDGVYCYSKSNTVLRSKNDVFTTGSKECVQRTKNVSRHHNGSKECGCIQGYYFEPSVGRCQSKPLSLAFDC